jgi:hypothetical protein
MQRYYYEMEYKKYNEANRILAKIKEIFPELKNLKTKN